MPSIISIAGLLPFFLSAVVALPSPASTVNPVLQRRNGCYTGGLQFSELHGDSDTFDMQEVRNDIFTTCQLAAGISLAPGAGWSHCSEWAFNRYSSCYEDCTEACSGVGGGGRGADLAIVGCTAGCDPNCGGWETGTNHINWYIKNDMSTDAAIEFDKCNAALNTELGRCSEGSEQEHEGWWYVMDPNDGTCSA